MRIIAVMDAVFDSYRGNQVAHQRLLTYSLEQGGTGLMDLLFADLCLTLEDQGIDSLTTSRVKFSKEEAFVLTRAITGVLREAIGKIADGTLKRKELEEGTQQEQF